MGAAEEASSKRDQDALEWLIKRTKRMRNLLILGGGALVVGLIVAVIALVATANSDSRQALRTANTTTAKALSTALQELNGSCDFYRVLGEVPLNASGPMKTSKLGVQLVIDSREAYMRQFCHPHLTPPLPVLIQLARQYDVPLQG